MRPGKRLFVGARISVATANTLAGCAETLARRARDAGVDLRWVAPANYHVTLAFLGWTGVDAIRPVCDALAEATVGESRLSFRTTRLGAFPSLDKATVLWAGVEDGGSLGRLARSIGEAMAGLGFRRDARPFHPHVTIARMREARAVRDVVLPMAEQMFGDTKIDAVTLFESETKSSGSVYREVEKIALKKARNPASEADGRQTVALEQGTPTREPDDTQTQTDDGWPRGQGPTD
ncbi:MAG TPA: RNA 2',3'-cyclic phosphodiesterase [Kofleriaceae bacterium]|nr:RNA 2',3'-cyclic phosphodiesterase [Kofleriaceae bacterium]